MYPVLRVASNLFWCLGWNRCPSTSWNPFSPFGSINIRILCRCSCRYCWICGNEDTLTTLNSWLQITSLAKMLMKTFQIFVIACFVHLRRRRCIQSYLPLVQVRNESSKWKNSNSVCFSPSSNFLISNRPKSNFLIFNRPIDRGSIKQFK